MAADPRINQQQVKRAGKTKKTVKRKAIPQPSEAEIAYGTGERAMPPMLHEMSETSQRVVRAGFKRSMSGWKRREQTFATSGGKGGTPAAGRLEPGVIKRLKNTTVGIDEAATNLAGHWETMMASDNRPDPAWYFGHNRRLTQVAEHHGMDPSTVIDAAGAMSPQNDPDSEFRAASAMADAITKGRHIRAVNDIYTDVTKEQAKKGVVPRLVMRAGERRKISAMSPEDMQAATSTSNVKNVSVAAGFDVAGFRNAGTNRKEGFRTLLGRGYNAVVGMKAAKVHLYTNVTKLSEPDTPLHHEYEMRFGDQDAARRVRQGRELDVQAGVTGSDAIRGVPDRVDLYGLMKGGADESDPAYHHPILGTRGMAVPDTWLAGLLSGQEMHDLPGAPSPGKMAGSQTATTHTKIEGTTFMSPAAAKAAGGKEMTGGAAWGMAALAAIQQGATQAREPEAQTNIPPVMMQEMPWVHGRGLVAESVQKMIDESAEVKGNAGTAGSRIARLTSGTLEGQKEFRPTQGPPSPVTRIETPGLFSRGYNNPLDIDSVTVIPGKAQRTPPHVSTPETSHADLADFHARAVAAAPDELSRRRAILKAQVSYDRTQRR